MAAPRHGELSRRERQIMDVLYRLEKAGVAEVRKQLRDPPGYDAVRTTLRILEEKGVVDHERVGRHYVYRPLAPGSAKEQALSHLIRTFFEGSAARAAVALLRCTDADLDEGELRRLEHRLGLRSRTGGEERPEHRESRE